MDSRSTNKSAIDWVDKARKRVGLQFALLALAAVCGLGLLAYAFAYPQPITGPEPGGSSVTGDFPGVARVQAAGKTGSAFLVDRTYALTAAHVAGATGTSVQLNFKDGTQVSGTVVASGYDDYQSYVTGSGTVSDGATPHDWALLELDEPQSFEWTVPVVTSVASVPLQSEVVVVGYPGGGEHNISSGILSGRDEDELRTDAGIDPGSSGGVLYSNEQKAAIGIVVSTPNINGQRASSVNNAVPIDLVIEKCRREGYLQMI